MLPENPPFKVIYLLIASQVVCFLGTFLALLLLILSKGTFLDYTELFAYNFAYQPINRETPREPLDTGEAIRLIIMEIRVTRIEPATADDKFGLPTVYFEGTSRSMHASWDPNATSRIRGAFMTRFRRE